MPCGPVKLTYQISHHIFPNTHFHHHIYSCLHSFDNISPICPFSHSCRDGHRVTKHIPTGTSCHSPLSVQPRHCPCMRPKTGHMPHLSRSMSSCPSVSCKITAKLSAWRSQPFCTLVPTYFSLSGSFPQVLVIAHPLLSFYFFMRFPHSWEYSLLVLYFQELICNQPVLSAPRLK